jgi:DNA-binding MarR family transcriptional regulator
MRSDDPFVAILQEWMAAFMRNSMRSFILSSKESGLSMSQFGAMFRIMRGDSSVSDLADELDVTSAAASQMLERLVQQGLILRSEDPHDRRAKQIVLTDKGREKLQAALLARQVWLETLANALTPAEKEQVGAALDILVKKAIVLEAHPSQER